jgi:hypothetical protein
VNTFLPYPSYSDTARVLDRARLGKQRVEGYQILRVLLGQTNGWKNHPAVKMWQGYEYQLVRYVHDICWEWSERGYNDSVGEKVAALYLSHRIYDRTPEEPPWLHDQSFHLAHQSNLIRKDPAFYESKFPGVPNNLPYIWPSKET